MTVAASHKLKQQKSKKVILLVSTLTMWRCAAKEYHLFDFCCFSCV